MNISNDMINKVIKECKWRNIKMGVAICNGNINLCSLEKNKTSGAIPLALDGG